MTLAQAPSEADEFVTGPEASALESGPPAGRDEFISARVLALIWLTALMIAGSINPATTEALQPTLVLTVLTNVAALAWLATIISGTLKYRRTAQIGLATGGFMLAGHLICGIDGHLPMTGGIWLTQLMLIAGATAVSGLAWATRS